MTQSPEDRPYSRGIADSDDRTWRFRAWTAEEWNRIRPGRRPRGVGCHGALRLEILCGDRSDGGMPVDPEAWPSAQPIRRARRRRDIPTNSILVDPAMPGMAGYVRQAILDGLIRTIPTGDGRICLIPVPRPPAWPGGLTF